MTPNALIAALRLIGKPVCTEAADRLAASAGRASGFDLHLRRAGLSADDARILSDGMRAAEGDGGLDLRSFSASYNPDLGDKGAAALADAFPANMTELGLVGCSIGDGGAQNLLAWAQKAPALTMICIEGNQISPDLKARFRDLGNRGRYVLVVV